jgi:uncharacterized LabA/DUF88 family protein
MKKTAILVDSEWFRIMLRLSFRAPPGSPAGTPSRLPPEGVTARIFYHNACATVDRKYEEIFRVLCYDCEPFAKPQINPIDKTKVPFGAGHPSFEARKKFARELASRPYVALRCGQVKGRGWEIKEERVKGLLRSASAASSVITIAASDIKYGLEQKGVDMRIGMDVASLSIKKLVDRIILICGDTDMVPAMKLARREGVQVVVVQVGKKHLSHQLIEDADLLRVLTPTLP